MKFVSYLLNTSIVIIFLACGSNEKTTAPKKEAISLEGNYWKLIELNGKPVITGLSIREPYITLTHQSSSVSGSGGCNRFGGGYELSPNGFNILFKQIIRTEMACEAPRIMDQENNFLRLLEMADNYKIHGNQLQLSNDKMVQLALFKWQQPKPDNVLQ